MRIFETQIYAQRFLLQMVAKGYHWWVSGVTNSLDEIENKHSKFTEFYGCDMSPSKKSYRKSKGLANTHFIVAKLPPEVMLAYKCGFFYDAHRASEDCRALLEVLQHPLPASGEIALKTLIVQMKEKCYKIYAISAPFDKKDLLKERGYRWNPTLKVWHSASVDKIDMNKEIEWLKGNVYCGKSVDLEFEEIDSETRYSGRQSVIITKSI